MMAARRRAARLAPEDRRAQLLACAIRVVARRGIGRATHAEIAAEAGVAVSTTFVYFKTRGDLVRAVLEEVERFQHALLDRHHHTGNSVPRALLDHAIAFASCVDTHPEHARVLLEWSTSIREEIWPLYVRFHDGMVARIAETIRRGQADGTVPAGLDAEDTGLLIVGAGHVVAQMKFTRQPPEKVHRFLLTLPRGAIGADAVAAALA
jgi:TetR/AcrR family transcriptional regulator, hemagglutinin/protease regulatory protein